MGKYLDKEGVKHLWGKIKALVDNAKRNAINAARYTLPAANGSTLGGVKSGGDVTITGGVVSVNDDSHNHVIGNVDGLQAALDAQGPDGHGRHRHHADSHHCLCAGGHRRA